MFECLKDLGITEEKFNEIAEMNIYLECMDEDDIKGPIHFLRDFGCSDIKIRNIIISDPFFLSRTVTDLVKTVKKLEEVGLKKEDISELMDGYPYILENDDFEIDEYVKRKVAEGMSLDEICDRIYDNPMEI